MTHDSNVSLYQCPHCKEAISVNQAVLDDEVDCPECGKPFRAPVPEAIPLETPTRSSGPKPTPTPNPVSGISSEQVKTQSDTEAEIRTVHPSFFRQNIFGSIACWSLVIGGFFCIYSGVMAGFAGVVGWLWTIGGTILLLSGGFFLIRWFLFSRTTSLTLTTERTVYREGILNKSTSEVQHDDVRNMKVDQNLLERILRYGDLAISSSGQDEMEIVIKNIPNPEQVVSFIRSQQ